MGNEKVRERDSELVRAKKNLRDCPHGGCKYCKAWLMGALDDFTAAQGEGAEEGGGDG